MTVTLKLKRDTDNSYPGEIDISSDDSTDVIQFDLHGQDRTIQIDKKELRKALRVLLED